MSRPRVLWISSSFPPQIGGLQQYCDAVTRHLAERVDLTIVTAEKQRPSARATLVECLHLGGCRTASELHALQERIGRIASEARPDVIHLGHAQMAALRPLFPARVPVVVTVHGNDLTSPWVRYGKRDMTAAIRDGLNGCRVLCVSEHAAAFVRSYSIEAAVTVVPNTCDVERFRRAAFDREAFLGRLGIPPDVPLLLSVSRLAPRKSHMTVMRALARLDVPFHWLIVGDGGERRRLELARLVLGMRRHVSMPGCVSENDLVLSYNAAHVFVLTPIERMVRGGIDSEGFGLVYHEAGACGTPSIASDVSGCREAVLNERTGLLVPPGEPARLRAAIRTLITDETLRRRLGDAAEAHVRAQGGWEAVARRIVGVYTEVLGAQRGREPAHG